MKKLGLILFVFCQMVDASPLSKDEISQLQKLRDPFRRPEPRVSEKKELSELQRYPVHRFQLVGVVTGPEHLKAMLLAPDGKTHFISENDKIGMREGKVKEIRSDVVKVIEKITNVFGEEENILTEIRLPEEGVSTEDSGSDYQSFQGGL